MAIGGGGVVNPLPTNGYTVSDTRFAPTFAEATVRFNTDGTIETYTTLGGWVDFGIGWYSRTESGIGSSFWIRRTDGTSYATGAGGAGSTQTTNFSAGAWVALSTARYFGIQYNATLPGTAGMTDAVFAIAADAAGALIVGSCTMGFATEST
jgi:hypothetical protein